MHLFCRVLGEKVGAEGNGPIGAGWAFLCETRSGARWTRILVAPWTLVPGPEA